MSEKFDEGVDFVKQAEKSLKTHFLKWKPDYEVAADKYQRAAVCFRNAKAFERSKDCLLRAADCYQQNLSLFHAAKCLDQVSLLAKDLNDFQHVLDLGMRASYLYLQDGSTQAAVTALDRSGKILETIKPEQSVKAYERAAEILKNDDNLKHAAEFLNRASRIMVKLQMYDQAAEAIRCEIRMHEDSEDYEPIPRLLVSLILVHMTREDYIAAEKVFKQWGNYCQLPEKMNLEYLLNSLDEEDPENIRKALNHPFIKHMDVDYAKLAKNMHLPFAENQPRQYIRPVPSMVAEASQYHTNPVPSNSEGQESSSAADSKQLVDGDEEEEEEGLC